MLYTRFYFMSEIHHNLETESIIISEYMYF